MRHYHYISFLLTISCCWLILPAAAQSQGYIQDELVKVPGITTESQVISLSSAQKITTRTYTDGQGRTVQTVALQASPTQKDIIQPVAYDNLGNTSTGYLPYSIANDGSYRPAALGAGGEQSAFYSNAAKVAHDTSAYAQQLFETSPLKRLLRAGSVGTGFQTGTGQHYKTANYRTNTTTDNVVIWNTSGVNSGYYPAGSLSINDIVTEDGAETLTFTNNQGQQVLRRQLANQTVGGILEPYFDTYYIYNEAGAVMYVVQPKAVATMQHSGNWSLSQTGIANLMFTYLYDNLGRLVQKTVPGGMSVYTIYDPLNRPVLVQDAKLRAANQWNYIKYDVKGHPISQGIYTDATHTGQAGMQTYVNTLDYSTVYFEERSATAATGYYTNNVFPASSIEPLAYSYYDNYDIDGNGTADYLYQATGITGESAATANTRGMLTAVRTRSVGQGLSSSWLIKVMFYDKNGRSIQVQGNNQLNTSVNDVQTIIADFTGKPNQVNVVKVAAGTTTSVLTSYTYDNVYRVTAIDQSYNGATAIHVASYSYNEIGQLVQKKLKPGTGAGTANVTLDATSSVNSGGTLNISASNSITLNPNFSAASGSTFTAVITPTSLQTLDYRYNIRGQLLSINNSKLSNDGDVTNGDTNDLFGMQLMYDAPDANISGATPSYSGRLSAVKWMSKNASGVSTNERSYKYNYDLLNRLVGANYAERTAAGTTGFTINPGAFDESGITYDENGNLLTLKRRSATTAVVSGVPVDSLNYTYSSTNPNQLQNVTDGIGGSYASFGFRNLTGSTGNYTYTADGSGSLSADPYKGLAITYNYLNKTDQITVTTSTNRYIRYTYDAGGQLLRKQQYDNNVLQTTTDYSDGFVYINNVLSYFAMPEGRVINTSGTLKPEFIITDQQGNARFSFSDNGSGAAAVVQENSYYAFGMVMANSTVPASTLPNTRLYNGGSEWQNDYNSLPDYYQTFYRNYDAALGRFISLDPDPESAESMSGYQYAGNNPLMYNDPLGDTNKPLPSPNEGTGNGGGSSGGSSAVGGIGYNNGWMDPWDAGRIISDALYNNYMEAQKLLAAAQSGDPEALAQYVKQNGGAAITIKQLERVVDVYNANGTINIGNDNKIVINSGNPLSFEGTQTRTINLNENNANQGGSSWLSDAYDWTKNHFYEEGSYEISRGTQLAIGIKKGLDVTLNAGSTVMYSGKVTNRNLKFEMDNSKRYTHEIGAAWIVGGGVKYTHDNVNPGEVELSIGALGFLGGSVTLDTNGNVTNWFGGINIDAHIAVYFGIQGTYKLGFAK